MRLPQRSSKAFTLIELIVVIVILGILALIAIPTFSKVIAKSQDESTLTTLRAIARDAQALRALDGAADWAASPVEAITDTSTATGTGLLAGRSLSAVVDDGTTNPSAGQVSYKVKGDGLILSMRSGANRVCVLGLNPGSLGASSCLAVGVDAQGAPTTTSTATALSSGTASVFPPNTPGVVSPPSAPGNVRATPGMESASVTWNASAVLDPKAPVTGYTLVFTSPSGDVIAKSSTGTATTFNATGLSGGVTYQLVVKADSAAGQGSPSAAVSVTPTVLVAPASAPANLTASGANASANLSWGSVASRDGYAIWRLDGSTPTLVGTSTTTSYKVTGLTNGTGYTFFVTARNGTLDSARSNTVSVTPSAWSPTSGTQATDIGISDPTRWSIVSSTANSTSYSVTISAQSTRRVYWQLTGDTGCTSNPVEQPSQNATFTIYATCSASNNVLRLMYSPQNSSYNGPSGFYTVSTWIR